MLIKGIYEENQSAMQFCKELVARMKIMYCESNKADMCIYFKCMATGLTLWIMCIYDCMV